MVELRKHASFRRIEENVVEVETDILEGRVGCGEVRLGGAPTEDEKVGRLPEGDVDFHIVVHQGNERKRKSRIPVEPEDQRNEQFLGRDGCGLDIEISRVTDHDLVSDLLLGGLCELVVDVVPKTVVLVNSGTSDLNGDLINKELTKVAGPRDGVSGADHGEFGGFH